MELVNPIFGRRNKKRFDLIFGIIEHSRSPFLMFALFHIAVLITASAVEFIKSESVLRKMSGNPVKYNAYACLMAAINKIH